MPKFWKYHGCGNDFVLVEDLEGSVSFSAHEIRRICDRHTGIGADGLLALRRSSSGTLRMDYWNSDGTRAEMCGNGFRCLVKHARDRGLVQMDRLIVETGAGPRNCEVFLGADGQVAEVKVDMGRPAGIPGDEAEGSSGFLVGRRIGLDGRELRLLTISLGNPHAVLFEEGATEGVARELGPQIENHELFPDRTNVEFARITARNAFDLVVWERGCGVTQACGTGACAAAVAGVMAHRLDAGEEIAVNLPGGTLRVTVEEDLSRVWLRGPAVRVFEGHWPDAGVGGHR